MGATEPGDEPRKDATFVQEQVQAHHDWFDRSIPMIASENVMSPLAREVFSSDFADRYAEGHPGKRYYQGCIYIDEVELRCTALAKRVFDCRRADVRPISGTNANMAVFFALGEPGQTVTACDTASGGHISHARFGSIGLRGLSVEAYPTFDVERMTLDPDATADFIREVEPAFALFGQSVFLFPTELDEGIADAAREVGAPVVYDGAHVMGLIGGGRFQDPLREGADLLVGSTHKTLPGPQGGIILSDTEDDDFWKRVDRKVFPGVVSNHHLHGVAAKAVTLAEHLEFGAAYATQVVDNAKALGQALHERGIAVFGEARGFTASHQVLVDVADHGGGKACAKELEDANVISNMNMVPGDGSAMDPSGLRFGTQEMTRIGMAEAHMDEVAGFIERVVVDKEDPAAVAEDVAAFRRDFKDVHFCFHEGHPAYAYHKVV